MRPSYASSLRPWAQPTPFVDRASDLETIRRRFADDGSRLLALTGPAGVGKTRLAEDLARALAAEPLADPGRTEALQIEPPGDLVSARERELLRLVAQGLANPAIARHLRLSPSTVSHLLTAIYRKLGVTTRAQAVAVAKQRGLLLGRPRSRVLSAAGSLSLPLCT